MATTAADRVFLDTNVLVAATDTARADHGAARDWLNSPVGGTLYTSGQVLREYLVVTTRPISANGLGVDRADALANVRALSERLRLLPESDKVANRLIWLLEQVDCGGKQIHDANIVATMLVHGVTTLVTSNVADFIRFADHVRAIPLVR